MRKSTPLFFVCLIVLATFTSALEDGLLPIDPPFGCNPTLCKNGATCKNVEISLETPFHGGPGPVEIKFECLCKPEWTGRFCDERKSLAFVSPSWPLVFSLTSFLL